MHLSERLGEVRHRLDDMSPARKRYTAAAAAAAGLLVWLALHQPSTPPSTDPAGPFTDRSRLHELLTAAGSDKGRHHGYTRFYAPLFEPLRKSRLRLVEIGVEKGKSMRAWQLYFTKAAHIFGIGYGNFQEAGSEPRDCFAFEKTRAGAGPQCTLYRGDQSSRAFLDEFVLSTGGDFDVVIDDGSHVPSHQRLTFERLFLAVAPGGLYTIEDIETSYWTRLNNEKEGTYGYSLRNETSIVEHFKLVADAVNREFRWGGGGGLSPLPAVYDSVSTITFAQNLIILRKQLPGEGKYSDRKYHLYDEAHCPRRETDCRRRA